MFFSSRLRSVGLCAALLCTYSIAQAQNMIVLSLEQAMDMAENYSFTARISAQNEIVADEQKNAQFRQLFPNISASGSYYIYDKNVNKAVATEDGPLFGVPSSSGGDSAVGAVTLTQPIVGLLPLILAVDQASAQARAAMHTKEQSLFRRCCRKTIA
jgi:outer membrane protein TolC